MKENRKEETSPTKAGLKFLTSTDFIHMMFKMKMNDTWKASIRGNKALDAKLYNLETGDWLSLLSYAKTGTYRLQVG